MDSRSRGGLGAESAVAAEWALVERGVAAAETEIARVASARTDLIPQVHRHLMQAGGKRLRPKLVILSARAVGEAGPRAVLLAAMVEVTHLASLLHDDVVDSAQTRRGQTAVNVKWGNSAAVLVADWLVARMYGELLAQGEVRAVELLAQAVGRMAEAELRQLERRDRPWDLPEALCLEIIESKTGALMAAACELGGLAGEGRADQLGALQRFGMALGTAFQLQDDLLDLTGDPSVLGKQVGSDIVAGQPTLPVLYALRNSTDGLLEELRAAVRLASPEELDLPRLRSLVEEAGGLDYARRTAEEFVRRAVEAVSVLPPSPAVEALEDLARGALNRER